MKRIIDLTRSLANGQAGVELENKYTKSVDGWNAKTLHLYSHTGTHMDAPFHFEASEETIDEMDLSRMLVSAHLFDIEISESSQSIALDSLCPERAAKVCPGDAVILRTGWSRQFDNFDHYRNALPRISEDLAKWLVDTKVGLLGVESLSVADVNDLEEVTLIHEILLRGNVIIVEGLVNLEQLGDEPFLFGAMPLKIEGGDGAPCRAFAIMEEA